MARLDHLILAVNDAAASSRFYQAILGFHDEGGRGPFTTLRINAELILQLAPWGTSGGEHLAFAMSTDEFAATFDRIRATDLAYGDSFHDVGNMRGPGEEDGAQGPGKAVYFFDPDRHLIEIRHYAD